MKATPGRSSLWSSLRSSLLVGLCAAVILGLPSVAWSDNQKKGLNPDDTVKDLLVRSGRTEDDGRRLTGPGGLARDAGTIVIVIGGGALLLLWWLKRRGFRGQVGGREPIEVVGRVALSPRHWLYLVEVGGNRVLLGVSGDRIARVMDIDGDDRGVGAMRTHDDPEDFAYDGGRDTQPGTRPGQPWSRDPDRATPGLDYDDRAHERQGQGQGQNPGLEPRSDGADALDVDRAAGPRDRTMWQRGNAPEAAAGEQVASPPGALNNELATYRHQVTRLQSLLQNWRDKLPTRWREEKPL